MGHQVQHHKVTPSASICSINRAKQFLDEGPIQRPWRHLISKTDRLIEQVKRGYDQVAVKAIAQKASQASYARSQKAARHSSGPLPYMPFDGGGGELLQRLAAG